MEEKYPLLGDRGKGIMQEAMPLICNYGFQHLDLHRIERFVETENVRCKNAIKKSNFVHEGAMRDCELKSGYSISLDIYAKIRPSIYPHSNSSSLNM